MERYIMTDNKSQSRYEYEVDGSFPHIEYKISAQDVIYLTHTRIPGPLQNKGIGSALVLDALKDIESRGMRLVPLCGFVAGYVKKYPEWKKLLAEGVYV